MNQVKSKIEMVQEKKDLVSIIMPVFNSEQFIGDAISSVMLQSFDNWELLICDDDSTDRSYELAKEFSKKESRIKVFRNRFEKGAAGARNTCLERAGGQYIAFLDSDDIWLPRKLESQLSFMMETGSCFVFGYCKNISEHGDFLSTTKAPTIVSLRKLLFSNFIPCLTVIYDTKILGKVEQPNVKKRNDFALWLRILAENRNIKAHCFPEVVAYYRVNNYGLSARKLDGVAYFYLCLRQYAGLGFMHAIFCTILAIVFKAFKTLTPQVYNLFVTKLL